VTNQPGYQNDSCEELLDLARANAQALVMGTAAFLSEIGAPHEAWTSFLGEMFAGSWDADLELDAGEFLDVMLTNLQSFGAHVLEATLAESEATATITSFPKQELCVELGVDCTLADSYLAVPAVLAGRFGLAWSWTRNGPRTRLTVARASESGG
jgi:hypothetical protein